MNVTYNGFRINKSSNKPLRSAETEDRIAEKDKDFIMDNSSQTLVRN